MSAQNTAQTTPIVSSTSAGPARASRSAVLTARFPSQASEQVNQTAKLLALAAAAKRADSLKDMAPMLVPAAEMNVNPFSGVMDTPEARRGLFDYMIRPNYGYEQLITVEIPLPHMWAGCTAKVALCYLSDMKQSHTGPTAGLVCRTLEMKVILIEGSIPKIDTFPESYTGPFADQIGEVGEADRTDLNYLPVCVSRWYTLKTPEFCTDNFFKRSTCNRSLTVDNVWNTYEDLCKTLRRFQQNGICQHVRDYYRRDLTYDDWNVHVFRMCGERAWFKGCRYCVEHQHMLHNKRRRTDEDSDED